MKIKQLKQNGLTFVPQTVSEAVLVKVGNEVLTLRHLLNFGNPELVLVSTGGIPKWENQSSINAGKLEGFSVDELKLLPAFAKFIIGNKAITADTLLDSIEFTGTNILISAQDKTINFAIPEMSAGVLGLVKGTKDPNLFLKGDGTWASPTNTWMANSKDTDGYVLRGYGQINKVWQTDEDGNPAWVDVSAHTHNTGNITLLTGYEKASEVSELKETDTLNSALGKLEYKANLGYDAYTWYKSITGEDTDNIVNKWEEIVKFVDSAAEGSDIMSLFVDISSDLKISGKKTFAEAPHFSSSFTITSTDCIRNLNALYLNGLNIHTIFKDLKNEDNGLSLTIGESEKTIENLLAFSASTLLGGAEGNIIYQEASGKTSFLETPELNGSVLKFNNGVPEWGLDYYRPISIDDTPILTKNNTPLNIKGGTNVTITPEIDSKYKYTGAITINSFYENTTYTINDSYLANTGFYITLTPSKGSKLYTSIPIMKGVSGENGGSAGLVPAPTMADRFLKSDGTWSTPNNTWRPISISDYTISDYSLNISAGQGFTISRSYDLENKKITATLNNTGVISVSFENNKLKVTTGGNVTNLTIPHSEHSSNADTVDGYHVAVVSELPSLKNSKTIYLVI